MPIAYIPRTRERYSKYKPYRWVVNHEAPWTPLGKPIRECRVALVSSGGFYVAGQPPFVDADPTFRLVPMDTRSEDLRIFHHGYRDDDPDRDPNCVFPIERLRDLAATGEIGGVAEAAVSFLMSYSPRLDMERATRIATELRRMAVDAALCVPV
ncbi:MAG TPA: glycine/sarcosine/betaine reductase selenoprotein B family protein [Candidatus Methylomirabilis sp.]|nr:glycine/sarcosine/betaine reductase selenoprotein B family protein [Candidatus Methylomirabilis sp.]